MSYGSWDRSQPGLRASDADRERVVEFLREQAGVGRLTPDELDERVGQAYHAVTVADLDRLLVDLPREQAPRRAPAPRPRTQPARRRHHPLAPLALIFLALFAGPPLIGALVAATFAIGFAAIGVVFALSFAFGPVLLVALLVALAVRRRRPRRMYHWDPRF